MNNREKLKLELNETYEQGRKIFEKIDDQNQFRFSYQSWYVKAFRVVQRFLPERADEFKMFYEPNPKRKSMGYGTYLIQDFLKGVIPSKINFPDFDSLGQVKFCFSNQLAILNALSENIDSFIFNIDDSIYYEYQEDELHAAASVLKINVRAAGALCGVVIEKHLKRLNELHKAEISKKITKKNPTISDLVEPLKDAGIIDTAAWRKITWMADIRNKCDHAKDLEPTREDVQELIEGSKWLINTVY